MPLVAYRVLELTPRLLKEKSISEDNNDIQLLISGAFFVVFLFLFSLKRPDILFKKLEGREIKGLYMK